MNISNDKQIIKKESSRKGLNNRENTNVLKKKELQK